MSIMIDDSRGRQILGHAPRRVTQDERWRWVGVVLAFCLALVCLACAADAAETANELLARAEGVLAQVEGEITVPGLREPVEVLRDRWGVPHIYANNQDDLFFAQGFVAAQDRLFQLEMWRRLARGETAEIAGPKAVAADRFARLIRYRGNMDAEWRSYTPEGSTLDVRRVAESFTAGINACIDHSAQRLPIEFQILGFKPGHWRAEDVLGRTSVLGVVFNLPREVLRCELISAVGVAQAQRIMPTDPPVAYEPADGLDLAGITEQVLAGYQGALQPAAFTTEPEGSNNWVVDGTRSASGKPMLAGDPHRKLALPSLRSIVHLNAPGWNVIGGGEPGLPGVAIGHNERIAWAFTVVVTDQADLVVEQTHPERPGEYRAGDDWLPLETERATIAVRGGEPVDVELQFTRNGPVIHTDAERNRAYVLRWVGSEPGTAAYLASLGIDQARSWGEFRRAVERWGTPSENIVYADVDGNIGWIAAAKTPIRRGYLGLLPVSGANGERRWDGFLPIDELPQLYNPPSHAIITANHNTLPTGYQHVIGYDFSAPYRHRRIQEMFDRHPTFSQEDFRRMQFDVTSLPGRELSAEAKRLADDAELGPFARIVAEWDGRMTSDSPAAALAELWLAELMREFLRHRVPDALVARLEETTTFRVMLGQLRDPQEAWFGGDAQRGRDLLLRVALQRAVADARRRLGDDPSQWRWGNLLKVKLRHPLSAAGETYAEAFNPPAVPGEGGHYTPNVAHWNKSFEREHSASYRQVFDLADWDRGLATSMPGQSGQPGSPHYADLLEGWVQGEYFPLAFSRAKVDELCQHRLTLQPADKPRSGQ